jgi:hypothetical protein
LLGVILVLLRSEVCEVTAVVTLATSSVAGAELASWSRSGPPWSDAASSHLSPLRLLRSGQLRGGATVLPKRDMSCQVVNSLWAWVALGMFPKPLS